ncbi:hypothetical protein EDD99_3913 [Streptomyces sp. 846.5]|nr:hypothetical protein [Streptomyces sp. 846.5]TDU05402.1 hypothetical protein EDD99_3913 [Streptomyces sp. 846.5]
MPGRIPEDAPSLVLVRYLNLGGALVLITATETGPRSLMAWSCTGCHTQSDRHYSLENHHKAANSHAATCRALPPKSAA